MTGKELNSYRLTSMEEPTDEQLAALMKEAAKVAKKKNEVAHKAFFQDIKNTVRKQKEVWAKKYNLNIV